MYNPHNPGTSVEDAAAQLVKDILAGERSIGEVLGPIHAGSTTMGLNADIKIPAGGKAEVPVAEHADLLPDDEHNRFLVSHVGPKDRAHPEVSDEYDLLVVGAGVAGLLSSIMAKALGQRVCLVEQHYMGGDCLNVGCFPSKCLIACGRRAREIRTSSELGISISPDAVKVDFPFIMERMRKLRAAIGPHDGVERYTRDFCESIFIGKAEFTSPHTAKVSGVPKEIKFKHAMIATGGSAGIPPVPGLAAIPHLTNNTFFNLTELPPRMVLIGAGPIGIEMAQTMAQLGSQVTVLEAAPQLLPREDPDAAKCLQESLATEPNLTIVTSCKILKVSGDVQDLATCAPWGLYKVELDGGVVIECEALLNATGRVPNVHGLGLDKAGVEYDTRQGVQVDDHFKTTADHIYACGDVASPFKFTHAADWQARTAIRNMFLGLKESSANLLTPWCTYTTPEIAHVGKYESELTEKCIPFISYTRKLADVDRCKCEGVTEGFVKITCRAGTDKILGATIVGPSAGDLISEITVCMTAGMGLSTLAGIIHPYPTTAEAIRQCAAIYWQSGNLKTHVNDEAIRLLLADRETILPQLHKHKPCWGTL
eukprot:TRINITY_DN33416_c0_g1_i1.p1 TRINITY_DN33416_c0_g1~~TRINITY_DN33416_c0_g1_i1.p1  ORF type:complete len:596 (+),score=128.99 TRINITY_DN33416_c0_g1_i1:67-1854(+)